MNHINCFLFTENQCSNCTLPIKTTSSRIILLMLSHLLNKYLSSRKVVGIHDIVTNEVHTVSCLFGTYNPLRREALKKYKKYKYCGG